MEKNLPYGRSTVGPIETDHFAEDGELVTVNGVHVVVLRLEAETVRLFVEGLDRGLVLEEGDDLVAVFGIRGLLDEDDVPVQDAGIDQRFS